MLESARERAKNKKKRAEDEITLMLANKDDLLETNSKKIKPRALQEIEDEGEESDKENSLNGSAGGVSRGNHNNESIIQFFKSYDSQSKGSSAITLGADRQGAP